WRRASSTCASSAEISSSAATSTSVAERLTSARIELSSIRSARNCPAPHPLSSTRRDLLDRRGGKAMAINGGFRPGHAAIRVREMEPAVKHYTEVLGLIETARDAQGRVFLKAWDEHDHHSVVLRQAAEPGMDYMGWRVDSMASLKKLASEVEGSGLAS